MPLTAQATAPCPQLVIVGGPTFVGKTTLVNAMIARFTARFFRPKSYTSRNRRPSEGDEEYTFATSEEIVSLHHARGLVNLDHVYGNYYGISRASVECGLAEGRIPIKEVHPANHDKIRAEYPSLVSILVTGERHIDAETAAVRGSRLDEDEAFYRHHDKLRHDIIFAVRPEEDEATNAARLAALIELLLKFDDRYPRPHEIDVLNRAGYDVIAGEFDDHRRITTSNFHDCSRAFFATQVAKLRGGSRCLEIGPGGGWLRKSIQWPAVEYHAVELASQMLARNGGEGTMICSSARDLPFPSGHFDTVIASLADPFLYPVAVAEIMRVLRHDGRLIFSAPSRGWSDHLRPDHLRNQTKFIRSDGTPATVFSFTHAEAELSELLSGVGFSFITTEVVPALPSLSGQVLSEAITSAARNGGMTLEQMPLMNLVVASR